MTDRSFGPISLSYPALSLAFVAGFAVNYAIHHDSLAQDRKGEIKQDPSALFDRAQSQALRPDSKAGLRLWMKANGVADMALPSQPQAEAAQAVFSKDTDPVALPEEVPPQVLDRLVSEEEMRLQAYMLAGQCLVGVGHAVLTPSGKPPKRCQLKISEDKALALLRQDAEAHYRQVREIAGPGLQTVNQAVALTTLSFNLGQGRVEPLLKKIGAKKVSRTHVPRLMMTTYLGGQAKKFPGIKKRRRGEAELFRTPDAVFHPLEFAVWVPTTAPATLMPLPERPVLCRGSDVLSRKACESLGQLVARNDS